MSVNVVFEGPFASYVLVEAGALAVAGLLGDPVLLMEGGRFQGPAEAGPGICLVAQVRPDLCLVVPRDQDRGRLEVACRDLLDSLQPGGAALALKSRPVPEASLPNRLARWLVAQAGGGGAALFGSELGLQAYAFYDEDAAVRRIYASEARDVLEDFHLDRLGSSQHWGFTPDHGWQPLTQEASEGAGVELLTLGVEEEVFDLPLWDVFDARLRRADLWEAFERILLV